MRVDQNSLTAALGNLALREAFQRLGYRGAAMSMLTDWLDWAIHSFSHEKADLPQSTTDADYEALLACYRSEQMSAAQLQAHMDGDPDFEMFVGSRMGEGRTSVKNSDRGRVLIHH